MTFVLSPDTILMWFLWGFFMGAGWTIASWLLGKVLR